MTADNTPTPPADGAQPAAHPLAEDDGPPPYPPTLLDDWRDLKARTWDAFIWWFMERVLHPIVKTMLRVTLAVTSRPAP